MGGGTARAQTGSHLTLNSLNFSVGVDTNVSTDKGQFTFGGAFEAGYGRFSNHFDAGDVDPYLKKKGRVSYYGLALVTGFMFNELYHLDATFRFGRMSSKQSDGLYNPATKTKHNIDLSSNYFGVELGGGKIFRLSDKSRIDVYGKYIYLHQGSGSFSFDADSYKNHAVQSHRLRIAGRYSYDLSKTVALYAGLGAEYEFDGKAKLTVSNSGISKAAKASELDGLRGFAEGGVTFKPSETSGLSFHLGIKGLYGNKYRGPWFNADIKYVF